MIIASKKQIPLGRRVGPRLGAALKLHIPTGVATRVGVWTLKATPGRLLRFLQKSGHECGDLGALLE
jgi:hypothetical protein